ncbi:hypothetical protein [Streptomyces sp. NPDC048272]|uniref:hypothetical protein n=1 Tax=Streptomyces sp. NPDC048272 TaxID=3154616 RepID=UPI003431199A
MTSHTLHGGRRRMAGTEFGHALGPSHALLGLPLAPLVARYGELLAAQQGLGLRHLGELLVPPGGRLRVLDGIFTVEGHGRRRHVGADVLEALAARRAAGTEPEAAALLRRLARIQRADPAALRRILLYQLTRLLHEHPRGGHPDTACAYGVDPDEAPALVRAAAARARLGEGQRAAAEALEDHWRASRVRAAARLAAALPPAGPDRELALRIDGVTRRARDADSLIDSARRCEERGDRERAAARYLEAARLTGDCPRAIRGLVRTHRSDGAASARDGTGTTPAAGTALEVGLVAGGVELRRAAAHAPVATAGDGAGPAGDWGRVLRLTRGAPAGEPLTQLPGSPRGGRLTDPSAPLGREVRYVALPATGSPLISPALLYAPEVTGLRCEDGPGRIAASWSVPAGAAGARAELTGPDGNTRELRNGRAEGLAVGDHLVRVRARYRPPGLPEVLSPGVETRVTVHPWPAPVRTLTADAREPGGLSFAWTGGEGADVRLVEWPGDAPEPGTELVAAALPAPCDGGRPPGGAPVRVTAVAVLGERALAGPSVLVETPEPVAGLAVRRTPGGRARVTFDWPADTGQVVVVAEQDGGRAEFPVARSVFLREGLHLPVGPGALRITAYAAPRHARSVVAAPDPGERIELPADVSIAYRVRPGARRGLRRGPARLLLTLSAPGGRPVGAELPEFVLIARGAGERDPARPRDPSDGTPVCRVGGAELAASGTVEQDIHLGARGPTYALRGFLLGGGAATVRLEEPPLTSLVVR